MNNILLSAMLFSILLCANLTVFAQTTAFTFQAKLTDSLVNANGPYDFTFRLFDQLANGTQIGSDIVINDAQVTSGIFAVQLDFGAAAFSSGAPRFVDIQVRPGASVGAYTQLAPRQQVTSVPYAVRSVNAATADTLNRVQIGRRGLDSVAIGRLGSPASLLHVCMDGVGVLTDCSSSLRYKTDLKPLTTGLAVVTALSPISFAWKDTGVRDIGLAAEDTAMVDEQLIFRNDKGEIEGVKYAQLSVVLINAVKEQQAEISGQQRQIDDLKSQIRLQ